MLSAITLLGIIVAAANTQAVTNPIAPQAPAPSGCSASFNGTFGFNLEMLPSTTPSSRVKRRAPIDSLSSQIKQSRSKILIEGRDTEDSIPVVCGAENSLTLTLEHGILKDKKDRIGYIASNRQFQFDAPVQSGAIYTAGFSVCDDNTIALGDSKTFYACTSGDFYNLYDENWAPQCNPVRFSVVRLKDCDSSQLIGKSKSNMR